MEGGSAGEEIALEKGWKVTTLEDQAAALMEVPPAPPTPPSSIC